MTISPQALLDYRAQPTESSVRSSRAHGREELVTGLGWERSSESKEEETSAPVPTASNCPQETPSEITLKKDTYFFLTPLS